MYFPKFLRIAAGNKNLLNSINKTDPSKISPASAIYKKLTEILTKKFRFTYELVFPSDVEYGRILTEEN